MFDKHSMAGAGRIVPTLKIWAIMGILIQRVPNQLIIAAWQTCTARQKPVFFRQNIEGVPNSSIIPLFTGFAIGFCPLICADTFSFV